MVTDGTSEMGSIFHDSPTGADDVSQEVTISKTGGTSPTVHPSPSSPSPHEQHTDSTMLPPLMPAPSSPSSSCGAIRSPWRHPDSERGQPSATDAGTLTMGADGTSEMGSVFHDPPTGADGHLQEDTISKMGSTSPTVHPSPCGQHTDSTMLPPLMPEPPSPSSSYGGHTKPLAAS